MHKFKRFLGAIFASFLLVGCGGGNNPSSNSSSEDTYHEIIVPIGYELSTNINVSGELIDIQAGEWMTVGYTYTFSFNFTNENAKEPIITSSDESIMTISSKGSTTYELSFHKASDVLLTIRENDENQSIHFRYVVHVHNGMTKEEADDFLVNTNYFKCTTEWWTGGKYEFIFQNAETFYINILASDESIQETYQGSYAFSMLDADEYVYTISDCKIGDGTIKLQTFRLMVNGYMLAVIDSQGLFGFFSPTNI